MINICLEHAYISNSYNAIHEARLLWYMENGKNENMRNQLNVLYQVYMQNTTNYDYLSKKLDKVLPPVTQITNIEFETKRKFCDSFNFSEMKFQVDKEHKRVYQILIYKKVFLDYLTSKVVAFKTNEEYCNWWKCIRRCKIKGVIKNDELIREYSRNLDIEKIHKNIAKDLLTYSLYSNKINSNSFNEDIVDYISNINDNDIVGFVNSENGELIELNTEFINYAKLKNKKAKQLRSIIETK